VFHADQSFVSHKKTSWQYIKFRRKRIELVRNDRIILEGSNMKAKILISAIVIVIIAISVVFAQNTSSPSLQTLNADTSSALNTTTPVTTTNTTTTTTNTNATTASTTPATSTKPNIIVIMGDDIGWFNIGAYHQGIMSGRTPNIDRLAKEGARYTDYYAEPSCTAGRANFITGELPIRTGLTTVGQAGADVGMPAEAPTIATALQALGYATGQFGKNHLGDLNKYLPCLHGFDEFYGYLYHLDAMEDPFWHSYPAVAKDTVGPRNMLHCWASGTSDPTIQPRWGEIGKQRIEDAGALPPERMKTVDNEILDKTFSFMDKAKASGKPFFIWLNPSRMHVYTHLSDKYKKMQTPENGWYTEEAGMAQLDDIVGSVLQKLQTMGIADNTIVVFTTDNGAEVFTWPDGGMTPFSGSKGMVQEGGMRVPMLVRWPGKVPAGTIENGIMSGLDWFPTLVAAAGNPNIVDELKQGKMLGDKSYKVHLDGYNQMNLLTGKGPSARHEILYFAEKTLGAVRIDDYKYVFIDQPTGWLGGTITLDWPLIYNLRLDPFERAGMPSGNKGSFEYGMSFYGHEFWRFVYVQDQIGKYAQTFIEFPPMQKGASFNMENIKEQVVKAIRAHEGG
jgi:arylsulfatase